MFTKYLPEIAILLFATTLFQTGFAEEMDEGAKKAALAATLQWLGEIDKGKYAESWKVAAQSFQKAVPEVKWVQALTTTRKPLGECMDRKVASQLYQTDMGNGVKGEFVVTQFESSFKNMKYTIETVTFEKEADGTWRASGYYIKPR